MATVIRDKEVLYLKLSWLEQIGAFYPAPKIAISEIESIEFAENPWNSKVMHGIRAPGTGFPLVIMLGVLRNFRGWRAFCAVYKRRPVVIFNFKSGPFKSWIITMDKSRVSDLNLELNFISGK